MLALALGRFAAGLTGSSLPSYIDEKARNCLINGYGIGLGSHDTPYAPVARKTAIDMFGNMSGDGSSTLLLHGGRTAISGAALANAALFHGRAQEDTCGAAHLGAILIPLLTAMMEARRYPMDRLIPALVAGYECGGLLEEAYARFTTPQGHRATALYGPIAAAAAAARLMDLPPERIAAAISNAASFAGGTLQSFADGTDEWRYHVGVAGHAGFLSASLAAAGSVSAPHGLEGPSGFIRAFAGPGRDWTRLAAQLGQVWAIERVTFKPFPVCAFNQTPVTAALHLHQEIAGRDISSVRIAMTPYEANYTGMDSKGPFSTIAGTLMSAPFCVAAALLYGRPTMAVMTDYANVPLGRLMNSVQLVADESMPPLCTRVDVELADGTRLSRDERKTPADYAYDRSGVSHLIRSVGAESGIPATAYERIERFVDRIPQGRIEEVIAVFNDAVPAR